MPEWNNTPWKKIVIKARKNFYVFLIQVDRQPSSSFFHESRSFRGFANTLLLLYSRIKRDFRPPKIGNRTGRYFIPLEWPQPPLCPKPWNERWLLSRVRRSPSPPFGNSGIFWVEWTPDITSSTKPKILFLSAVFRFCYAAADRWKSETDLTGQAGSWIYPEFMLSYLQAQFSHWAIVIDFWWGKEKKRKGGIDIGSWNIFPRESKMKSNRK